MKRSINKSLALQRRANELIAHGALTNSKHPKTFVEGVYPTHVNAAHKCYVTDADGNRYIDFICALGTNLFGYANSDIGRHVFDKYAFGGAVCSLSSVEEVELAEKLQGTFPFLERMRFLKTGSEGCQSAILIARAYHGHDYDNEDLQEMLFKEAVFRISQEGGLDRWSSQRMQDLCQGVSGSTSNSRNKSASKQEVLANPPGESDRTSSKNKEAAKSQESWPGQSLLSNQKSPPLWGTHQAIVRSMWERELSSPSSRLREALGNKLAVPGVPRKGARWLVLSDGYHGHASEFVSLTKPSSGVPPHFGILPLTKNEHLIRIAAAVIIEPVITDFSENRVNYIHSLRETCTKHGTILIFDETITAYRFKDFSVAKATGITPDLWIGGKAIAGGFPLSVVGGKKEIMEADYFVSSTWAGDRLAINAAIKANELVHGPFHPNDLWGMGKTFLEKFNSLSSKIKVNGYPTRGVFECEDLTFKALFWQECCKAGVLFGPSWFYNKFLHAEMDNVISICKSVIKNIEDGKVQIEGKLPVSPFAQRVRDAN